MNRDMFLWIVIAGLIGIVVILLVLRKRKGKSVGAPQVFRGDSDVETFCAYFDAGFDLLCTTKLFTKNKIELYAFLSAVGASSLQMTGGNAVKFVTEIDLYLYRVFGTATMERVSNRRSFYHSVCKGGPAYGFWSPVDIPVSILAVPMLRCAVAFGDCVTDYHRIIDYENSPVMVPDFSDTQEFSLMFNRDFYRFVKTFCIAIVGHEFMPITLKLNPKDPTSACIS